MKRGRLHWEEEGMWWVIWDSFLTHFLSCGFKTRPRARVKP